MLFFRNFSEAQGEIRKGLALDPSYVYAHEVSCWFNLEMGRSPEAITECRKAVELDSFSMIDNFILGRAYYHNRDYDQAIEQFNKTLEIDPKFADAVANIGAAYEQMGNYKQAMEQYIKFEQLRGHESRAEELRDVFEKSGYKGYLRKDAKDNEAVGDHYNAACDYAMLGEKDAAFAALESASLITLGGVAPCRPSSSGACLIDQNLATNGNGNATTTSTKGKSGYQFAAAPGTNAVTQFLTTATPTSASSGSKYYCAVEDGTVRSAVSAGGTTPIVNTACYTTNPLAN
jgi:TolA-binding protein